MGDTINAVIERWAQTRPNAPAIGAVDGSSTTYGELAGLLTDRSRDLSGRGIQPTDRVAIVLGNGPVLAGSFLSIAAHATAAPLNPALTTPEYEFCLADLDARALVIEAGAGERDHAAAEAARSLGVEVLEIEPDPGSPARFEFAGTVTGSMPSGSPRSTDVALVLHTSGTTARPKIVPLTHTNLLASAGNVATTLRLTETDTCLNVMPLFHIHGLVAALLATVVAGASVVCTPGFRGPAFFEWLRAADASWYTAVPTMHQSILERAKAGEWTPGEGGLRLARSSSASLAPSVLEGLEAALGVPVIEAYGMTEAAHQMASNPLPPRARKPGSVGPAAGPEVRIADESGRLLGTSEVGEVVIRGDNVTAGYHGLADQSSHFHRDGWFRTGDQGFLDDDGYLFLTGRLKEIINRGGETIAPREIDEALLEIDGVRQAVAFAVPDRSLGEEVGAAVVLDPGRHLAEVDLQDRLAAVLAVAKVPKRIVFLDEIPKGPTGKLQRIGLAERLGIDSVSSSGEGEADTSIVSRLTALWLKSLELDQVGVDDRFLESGGDSVTATRLAVEVEREFGVELPLMAFFRAATITEQASLISELVLGDSDRR